MTWKEFKSKLEAAGVTDDMSIYYMGADCPDDSLEVELYPEDNGFSVYA